MTHFDGQTVIASVSGGKDSTAMCLHFKEQGIPFVPVFMDTGWENSSTYEYLRDYLPGIIGEITWLTAEVTLPDELEPIAKEFEDMMGFRSAMVRRCIKRGMFPSRLQRWCTKELKVIPIRDYLRSREDDVVNAVGIRHEESASRAKMDEWEWEDAYDCWVWRPIITFSEQDVIDIHARHGVLPNPNYLLGARRVGCWPCIYAAKKELHYLADNDDGRIAVLTRLEEVVGEMAEKRAQAKGTTLEARGHTRPAWFQNPAPVRDPVTGKRPGDCWPIAKVLEWAKTKYGGRQYELFLPPMRDRGCMRWGLCDTGEDE